MIGRDCSNHSVPSRSNAHSTSCGDAGAVLQPLPGRVQLVELGRAQASSSRTGYAVRRVEHVVIGGHAAVDHHVTETGHGVHDHLRAAPGHRVRGEQHPGGSRVDHPLHHHGHRTASVGDARRLAVGDRPRARQRSPAVPHRVEQRLRAADAEHRLVLAGEAGLRQVLGRGAGPDGDRADRRAAGRPRRSPGSDPHRVPRTRACAALVTQNPSGTRSPARISSARPAALPPTRPDIPSSTSASATTPLIAPTPERPRRSPGSARGSAPSAPSTRAAAPSAQR